MKTAVTYFLISLLFTSAYFNSVSAGADKPTAFNRTGVKNTLSKTKKAHSFNEKLLSTVNLTNKNKTLVTYALGVITVSPDTLYDNDVAGGAQGLTRTIKVKNTGSGILTLSSITLTGTNASEFVLSGLPTFPAAINAGDSISFSEAFNPVSKGIKTAFININSDDASNPALAVALRGLGTTGLGGANEPSLQSLLDLYQIQVNAGDDDPSTNVINSDTTLQKAALLGDEISMQRFQKAGSGNVTITPLAVFGPTGNATVVALGWYKSGNVATNAQLLSVSNNPLSNGQTVNVNYTGSLSFDPSSNNFGFYSRWPFFNNRHLYSEDNLNTFAGSVGHHVRVYPYVKNGVTIANSYVVAFEETITALDYQDILFVVSNVKPATPSNALLFAENLDRFPDNDDLVFSRVQIPWSRDGVNFNDNHDSVVLRLHSNGISPLIINGLSLSNDTTWRIEKLNGIAYDSATSFPLTINSGGFADVLLRFTAQNQGTRVTVLHEILTIISNDDKYPGKSIFLHGLWQNSGEGIHEPYAQEIINAFGFKTSTGFNHTDPDHGDSTKLKGDEIKPSFFVNADTSLPVSIRQMSAYHGCCTATERIMWYTKDSTTLHTVFNHISQDGQSLLPRKSLAGNPAAASFKTATVFGFKIGSTDNSDASKNPNGEIGIRVWKAINSKGKIIPNTYIVSNDYLGSSSTNYDYNDNTYYISNIKPAVGTAYYSALGVSPSDLDFGIKDLNTTSSLQLNISSLGKTYSNGTADPTLTISSLEITGENRSEFTATLPANRVLAPQQSASIMVNFKPVTEGLKIADLLIYYNNALSPQRVPLYGIGRAANDTVVVNYRVNSGAARQITINGKTWSADTLYSFNNLEPYVNPAVHSIAGTDEDSLYFDEQSSNADKRPFSYQFPVANGTYVVRLRFAEIFFGQPGSGVNGGIGSRTFDVSLENQLRLTNFDITQEVGKATAVIKNIPVTVTDGNLNIDFSATVNRPMVSAIEVYSFRPSAVLGLNFLDFNGTLKDKKAVLNWKTSDEINTKDFEVERATNNADFVTLGTVAAANIAATINTYNFIDNDPGTPYNYYRIKEVDIDGKITYSRIIRIDFSNQFAVQLLPNPVHNKLQLLFSGMQGNRKAELSIFNVSGSKMKQMPVTLTNQKLEVDVSALSPGMYILKVTGDNIEIQNKFLKK